VEESTQGSCCSLEEDSCSSQEEVPGLEEEDVCCSQSTHCKAQEVHEEQGLQGQVPCSRQGSHCTLQKMACQPQEASQEQEMEEEVVQDALLEEGTCCKAEVEGAPRMLEEQGLQGQTVGSPCSSS